MNNRLNIQDLATLLSESTGKERLEVELFLRGLLNLVSEGVYRDKIAKVKGLGTFKVVSVGERESVNVNTGERFIIPSHYKFSFIPDKELREQVNKPFSIFETTELNDNVEFSGLDNQIEGEEHDDIQDEVIAIPQTDNLMREDTDVKDEPELEELAVEKPEEVQQRVDEELQSSAEDEQPSAVVEKPVVVDEQPADVEQSIAEEEQQIIEGEQPLEEESPSEPIVDEQPKKETNRKRKSFAFFLFVFISHVFMAVAYFVYKYYEAKDYAAMTSEIEQVESESKLETEVVLPADSLASAVTDSIAVDERKQLDQEAVPKAEYKSLGSVKIKHGDRLTVIALEYYGNKLFWVYIYQHNKRLIDDPNNVPIGTIIEIPAKELYQIDAKDPKSRMRAAELQTEILTGKI